MTIDELMERLEEYREQIGGDAEVRLMTQPSWPFEYSLQGVCSSDEINEQDDDDSEDQDVADDNVVYLVEGTQLGYGSSRAWNIDH